LSDKSDHVDGVIRQWNQERPDLDASPMAIFGRMSRVNAIVMKKLRDNFKNFGLDPGDFDVLATLLRAGPPYALKPTQLYHATMLSSGTMTSRVDKLEKMGFVKRTPDDEDRRAVHVQLTSNGKNKISEAVTSHVNIQQSLLQSFDPAEREIFAKLLKQWLLDYENPSPL